jgi:hypothetical protein
MVFKGRVSGLEGFFSPAPTSDSLVGVLPAIGGNLLSLKGRVLRLEEVGRIVEYCPNLEYLEIDFDVVDEEVPDAGKRLIKEGLKKLAKLVINGRVVQLRTERTDYFSSCLSRF